MFTKTIDKTPSVPNSPSSKAAQKKYVYLPIVNENELLNTVYILSDPFTLADTCGLLVSFFKSIYNAERQGF